MSNSSAHAGPRRGRGKRSLDFWQARLREVSPDTREQCCWWRK